MSETIADLISSVESADGYLTDAWLNRLRAFDFTFKIAAHFLVWLPNIKPRLACCDIRLARGATELGKPAELIEFHTGGWSGAADLIEVMLGHSRIKYFHTKWSRGGHFTFEIPVSVLRGIEPTPARKTLETIRTKSHYPRTPPCTPGKG